MLPGQVQASRCMETGALRTAFLLASSAGLVVEPLIGAHPHLRTQVHVHVQTHAQQGFDGRDLQSTGELDCKSWPLRTIRASMPFWAVTAAFCSHSTI